MEEIKVEWKKIKRQWIGERVNENGQEVRNDKWTKNK